MRRRFLMGMVLDKGIWENYSYTYLYHSLIPQTIDSKNVLNKARLGTIEGNSEVVNQLVDTNDTSITLGTHKYLTYISGTWSLITGTSQTLSVNGGTDMVIDLTQRYPFDTPTTLDDVRVQNILAQGYIPYNTGEIKDTLISELEAQPFNIWDELTELGRIDITTGASVADGERLRSVNYIELVSGKTYYTKCPNTVSLFFYDKNYDYINYTNVANQTFVAPNNAKYLKFFVSQSYGTTYNNDICINVSSSLNGTYKPYQAPSTLQLPAPLQIGGVNTAHNTFEVTNTGYVFTRNMFETNLGIIPENRWTVNSSAPNGTNFFCSPSANGLNIKSISTSEQPNALCSKYACVKHTQIDSGADKSMSITGGTNSYGICIRDTSLGSTPTQAQIVSAMANVILKYQLATPQVITIPKKHLGVKRIRDITNNWARGTYVFYSPSGVFDNANNGNNYCSAFIYSTETNANKPDLSFEITNVGGINIKVNSISTVEDFLEKYGDDYVWYETEDEVADFTNNVNIQSGGTLNGQCARLPLAYQECEYIESTGTQWVDSGYIMKTPTKAEYSFMITGSVSNGHSICGVYNNNNDLYFGIVRSADSKLNYRYKNDFYASTTIIIQNTKYSALVELNVGSQKLTLNGVLETTSSNSSTITNSLNAYLFAINGASEANKMVGRLYYFKIYDNSALVRNFVPCYRKSDNAIGLYDLVNGVFYTNKGTGTFLKGADVDSPTCEVLPNVEMLFKSK